MKIYIENKKVLVKGLDKVSARFFWIILLCIISFSYPILHFLKEMPYVEIVLILTSLVSILVLLEFGFRFKLEFSKNELIINKLLLNINTHTIKFEFEEITLGCNKDWIEFKNKNQRVLIEVENGLENNTINIYSQKLEIEIGRRNDGKKLIQQLPQQLIKIGAKLD